jgi:hypothetical protein
MATDIQPNPHFFHHLIGPLINSKQHGLVDLIGGGFIPGFNVDFEDVDFDSEDAESDEDSHNSSRPQSPQPPIIGQSTNTTQLPTPTNVVSGAFQSAQQQSASSNINQPNNPLVSDVVSVAVQSAIRTANQLLQQSPINAGQPQPASSNINSPLVSGAFQSAQQQQSASSNINQPNNPLVSDVVSVAVQSAILTATNLLQQNPINAGQPQPASSNINSQLVSTANQLLQPNSTNARQQPLASSNSNINQPNNSLVSVAVQSAILTANQLLQPNSTNARQQPPLVGSSNIVPRSIPANNAFSALAAITYNITKPAASTTPLIPNSTANSTANKLLTQSSTNANRNRQPVAPLIDPYYSRGHTNPPVLTEDLAAPAFLYETDNDGNEHPNGFMIGDISYRYIPHAVSVASGSSSGPSSVAPGPSSVAPGPSSVASGSSSVASGTIQASAVSVARTLVQNILSGPGAPASGPSAPASGPGAPASGPGAPALGSFEFEESFYNKDTTTLDKIPIVSRLVQFNPSNQKIIIKDTSSEISEKDYTDYGFFAKNTTNQFNFYTIKLTSAINEFINKLKS